MSDLFNPSKAERAAIRRGDKKIALHNLKADGDISETDCPFCGRRVFFRSARNQYLTLTGSRHKCKGMPLDR